MPKERRGMVRKTFLRVTLLIGISLLFAIFTAFQDSPQKIKVVVDNASIKATPEIGGKTIARIPLDTILDTEEKQGEWYKVSMDNEGVQISGFIHEMLVAAFTEEQVDVGEVAPSTRPEMTQPELVAEIVLRMENSKKFVRQEEDFGQALEALKPLIARVFNVTDNQRQKELATEIYLWTGLAYTGKGDDLTALRELRSMFEVNRPYAKEITRNIFDPKIVALIQQAEREYLGLVTEYTLEVETEPSGAVIRVDGREVAFSPGVYKTTSPNFVIEVEKEGFMPIREEIFMTQAEMKQTYALERAGWNLEIRSRPDGALVFLDGEDTRKVTDCILPYVTFGMHRIVISKENFTSWEGQVLVEEEQRPSAIDVLLVPTVYDFIAKWGGPDKIFLQQPSGITLDKEDNVYIADLSDSRIKKFDPEGKILRTWIPPKHEFKKVKIPGGVAVDKDTSIYITDLDKHSVSRFDKAGRLIRKWGKQGVGNLEFNTPVGIAVDGDANVYVVDAGNHCIKKYSHLGVFKKRWGKQGRKDGEFFYPAGIALNQKNQIFVIDRLRVQKFTLEGEFVSSWGKPGTGDGEFDKPHGLWVDKDNYVYVADSGNNRIQKFDKNGKFISKWGTRGAGDGMMNFPNGVVVSSQGTVFVIERNNNRLQIFKPKTGSE